MCHVFFSVLDSLLSVIKIKQNSRIFLFEKKEVETARESCVSAEALLAQQCMGPDWG